ncbi:MAG TPA: S8 family peptidase, partial [Pyrinomonadaceae bacterium]|nr:S8 family peptidase [Pyrinomonadaceae bacterium]
MSRPLVKRLVTLAVLFSLCSAPLLFSNTKVQAVGHNSNTTVTDSKISPDLRHLILSGQGDKRVKVIVQQVQETTSGGLLGGLLNTVGGLLEGVLALLNVRILDVRVNDVEVLATDPNVSYISLDAPVRSSGHLTTTTGAQQVRVQKTLLGTNNLDGSGVTIAVLDSGIDKNHKSFAATGKIKFNKDFTGENRTDDPWGHGTHVAAIAAGIGSPTAGAYEGIAPGANLVNLRVLDSQGVGKVSGVLTALEWVLANKNSYGIRVVNMSLGTLAVNSYKADPICAAVRKLVNAGVVVVAAAGNMGKDDNGRRLYGAIHAPGNEPAAITVGASNSFGTDGRNDDGVTSYSSRGPTRSFSIDSYGLVHFDNIIKPDLVAPGNKIISASAANNNLLKLYPELETNKYSTSNMKLMYLSGTSMSTPAVAGAAAMLLEANSSLTPNMIKMLLLYTAQPLSGFNT